MTGLTEMPWREIAMCPPIRHVRHCGIIAVLLCCILLVDMGGHRRLADAVVVDYGTQCSECTVRYWFDVQVIHSQFSLTDNPTVSS